MVNTSWDMFREHIKNKVPLISVEEVLDYDDDLVLGEISDDEIWITRTHYRSDSAKHKGFSHIAFQIIDFEVYGYTLDKNEIDKKFDLYLVTNDEEYSDKNKLKYDSNKDLWFEYANAKTANKEMRERGYKSMYSTEISGITASGFAYIIIVNKESKDTIYKSPQILYLPSSMSMSEYKQMIYELIYLRDELVSDKKSKVAIGVKEDYPLSLIEDCIIKLEHFLLLIDRNPNRNLIKTYEYKKIKDIKNPTYKNLVNRYIYPSRRKHKVEVYNESTNVYENQVIQLTLLRLKRKLEYYLEHIEIVTKQNLNIEEKNLAEEKIKLVNYAGKNNAYNIEIEYAKIKEKESKFLERLKVKQKLTILNKNAIRIKLHLKKELDDIKGISLDTDQMETFFKSTYNKEVGWDLSFNYEIYDTLNRKYERVNIGNQKHLIGITKLISNDIKKHLFLLSNLEKLKRNEGIVIEALALIPMGSISKDDVFQVGYAREDSNTYSKHEIILTEIYKINDYKFEDFSNNLGNDEAVNIFYNFDKTMQGIDDIILPFENLNKQLENINDRYNNVINQKDKIITMIDKTNNLLKLSFLMNTEEKNIIIKPTQLFFKDKIYRQVWNIINFMDNRVRFLHEDLDNEVIPLKKTCDIYEIWCYFKMLHLLINQIGWETNDDSIAEKLDRLFNSRGKNNIPNGFYISLSHLTHEGDKLELKVYFNPSIEGLRPDYYFEFLKPGETVNVYLDAKYRDYGSQGRQQYINDIEITAYEKYIKRFESTNSKASASFVMHCDERKEYTNFGGFYDKSKYPFKNEKRLYSPGHKYGAFKFRPSDSQSFITWFKMIMEYILPYFETCWNCGEDKNIKINKRFTKSMYPKYHYYCENCNAFWVKNHCDKGTHKLVKHITSYHYIDPDKNSIWYVKCPKCIEDDMHYQEDPWLGIFEGLY